MTIYDEVQQMLEESQTPRERRFRVRGLRELVLRKLGLEGVMFFPMDKLDDFAVLYGSYDRAWRLVMSDREDLRGSDYSRKDVLEQEKELELGYAPGFHGDAKKLAEITA